MTAWTKNTAISEIKVIIDEIDVLPNYKRFSAEHTRWLARTLAFLEDVFGRESRYYLSIAALPWSRQGSFIVGGPGDIEGVYNPNAAVEREHQKAYVEQLDAAKGLLLAALDHLRRIKDINSVYAGKNTPPESSLILKVINIAERMLRKAVRQVPTREKEVQDAFENLLIGSEIPYSRESESIEYSSKTYTPDFTVSKIDLTIEIKLCSRDGREKEVIAEINDDILAYQTKFGNLLFIVYDVGLIRNVDLFISSFEKHPNVIVRVVKH